MISFKYAKIENEADKIWKFERYALVYEYYSKPILPAPFEIFSFVIIALKYFLREYYFKKRPIMSINNNLFVKALFEFSKKYEIGFGEKI